MRIPGMELYRKRRTDAEYVETVRKTVAWSKWLALFHAVMAAFFLGCYLLVHRWVYNIESSLLGVAQEVSPGVHIGLMLGAFMGLLLVFAVASITWGMNILMGQRAGRLMLEFHDQLKKGGKDFQATDPADS